ncbi:MAG: hypothetical protein A2X26_08530 [Chloroflexi bacterium GWC2_49_37]|nr:MAG: hypothetical protein A2X26_08530 [Chloroflexi bacterium GWC2_49_37]
MSWGASTGATSYSVCYDTTNDNACSSWVSTGTTTNKPLSGLTPGATYYWQVRANNLGGTTYANAAAYWFFTTANPTFQLSVSTTTTASGTVTSSPAGINCGLDCLETYVNNTSVTLTAATSAGYTFTGWSGSGCSGTGTCIVSMTAARSVAANFIQIPTNLQASDGTFTDKVQLSWTASSGATSYNVYRATSTSGTKSLLGSPVTTTFADSTATPGVSYVYWVRGCNGATCSGYSAYNSGWRNLSAPTNLLASDGTYTDKVRVSWTASSGATSYKVIRSTSAAGAKTLLGSPSGTALGDTTAIPGVTYYYFVKACRGTRCSVYSAYNTGWRNLSAPANLQASDGTYTSLVRVTWTASSGATSYKLIRSTTATGPKTLLGSPTVTTFDDTTATPGLTYYYFVKACRGARCSVYSAYNTGWRKP